MRHAATVNAEWGNEAAVLTGDYLFTHAFHLAASLDSTLACRWIGRATNLVCEGEMQQVSQPEARQPRPGRGRLLRDHPRQDGQELTAVSCRLGAPVRRRARAGRRRDGPIRPRPGRRLPDRRRRARPSGARSGRPARRWAPTWNSRSSPWPIIQNAGDRAHPDRRPHPQPARRPGRRPPPRTPGPYLEDGGALEYAWERAEDCVESALAALDVLAESPAKGHAADPRPLGRPPGDLSDLKSPPNHPAAASRFDPKS